MLILRTVTRIRVHNWLSIRQVLSQDERVNGRDHNILVPMNDQGRMRNVF
jgi:hypothetical protein